MCACRKNWGMISLFLKLLETFPGVLGFFFFEGRGEEGREVESCNPFSDKMKRTVK